MHFHALGDRAVREALDAVEAARRANGPSDHRHHLAHIQVVHPDDIPRFRELGAVANVQPLWAAHESQMDELTIPFLGEPRGPWQYPFGDLLRAGAVLAIGSDWSVSSPEPARADPRRGEPGHAPDYPYRVENHEVFLPEERIDLATAIAGVHDGLGLREPPRRDDRVDRGRQARRPRGPRPRPVRAPAEEIADAQVVLTLVEGERVFAAGDLA